VVFKYSLDIEQTALCGEFVNRKFVLSSTFRYDVIYYSLRYYFGHTLLYFLSLTKMFDKLTYVVSLLITSSYLVPALGVMKFMTDWNSILATLLVSNLDIKQIEKYGEFLVTKVHAWLKL
jgi:hypothetical protein